MNKIKGMWFILLYRLGFIPDGWWEDPKDGKYKLCHPGDKHRRF